MIDQGEILTLDDNKKYSVVYSKTIENKNYVYLIDQDDYTNTMFCEFDNNDGLQEINNPETIELLLKTFALENKNNK